MGTNSAVFLMYHEIELADRPLSQSEAGYVRYVIPRVWKGYFGLSSDKEQSRLKAIALFPDCANLFSRKKDEGRAEAALIALWEAVQ